MEDGGGGCFRGGFARWYPPSRPAEMEPSPEVPRMSRPRRGGDDFVVCVVPLAQAEFEIDDLGVFVDGDERRGRSGHHLGGPPPNDAHVVLVPRGLSAVLFDREIVMAQRDESAEE